MKIKVSCPWQRLGLGVDEFVVNGQVLRCDWQPDETEGMIGFWEFTEEFLAFKGPKVFYCCEPSFYFGGFRASKRLLRARLASLRQDEFAWHYHPEEAMRVAHHTNHPRATDETGGGYVADRASSRKAAVAAVVGNLGHPLARNAGRQLRLRFILESGCDIYGSKANWERFQLRLWSRKGAPATYRGPCQYKLNTIAAYHACICLENSAEPLYFTEKFPDAVRSSCVPIYHAHTSVKREFLQGAVWVDPADHDWDARATVEAAVNLDRKAVDDANKQWLQVHPKLQETALPRVYFRLAGILARKVAGEIHLPGQATRERLKDEY